MEISNVESTTVIVFGINTRCVRNVAFSITRNNVHSVDTTAIAYLLCKLNYIPNLQFLI